MTAKVSDHYILPMTTTERPSTELTTAVELELERLQKKVEQLVLRCQGLETENRQLQKRQSTLTEKQAGLVSNTEQVNHRIETMLSRLKTLEHNI